MALSEDYRNKSTFLWMIKLQTEAEILRPRTLFLLQGRNTKESQHQIIQKESKIWFLLCEMNGVYSTVMEPSISIVSQEDHKSSHSHDQTWFYDFFFALIGRRMPWSLSGFMYFEQNSWWGCWSEIFQISWVGGSDWVWMWMGVSIFVYYDKCVWMTASSTHIQGSCTKTN